MSARSAALTAMVLAGCTTSGDATAAAAQMATTAQTLSSYYKALQTTFEETDELYQLNEQLYAKPYTAENRQQMKSNEAELATRVKLASDVSALSQSFGQLTGSAAPADAASAASQVESDVDKLTSVKASATEQNALKAAVQALGSAIRQHKEREAAKAMESAAQSLSDLFAKETDVWNSTEEVYSQIAANLAGNLVDANVTDNSAVLDVALTPFGLVRSSSLGDINAKLAPVAKMQITTKQAAMDASYASATNSMANALKEMAQRIQTVANDKAMTFRTAPLTLTNVQQWTTQVTTLATGTAPPSATTGASTKTSSGKEQ
ncbi:MAG TPA: hypothetical protein VHX13_04050 [Acidobacteriaceae bacterium]|jgi:hypothetical protein|nr:hypothetical protein [Acidobacteriaceae bacterium]